MSFFFRIFEKLFKGKKKEEKNRREKRINASEEKKREMKKDERLFSFFEKMRTFLNRYLYLIAFFVILAAFSIFSRGIRTAFILICFMVVTALSKLIQEPIPFVVGLDLCLFYTVTVSYAVNPIIGFLGGGIASIIGSLLRSQQNPDTMAMPVLGYLICALTTGILKHFGMGLIHIGVICSVIYAMLMVFIFSRIRGITIHTFTFLFTSLTFNIFLFTHFSEKIVAII